MERILGPAPPGNTGPASSNVSTVSTRLVPANREGPALALPLRNTLCLPMAARSAPKANLPTDPRFCLLSLLPKHVVTAALRQAQGRLSAVQAWAKPGAPRFARSNRQAEAPPCLEK